MNSRIFVFGRGAHDAFEARGVAAEVAVLEGSDAIEQTRSRRWRRLKFYFYTGTAAVNKWWEILYQMNLADGALLNETAWSALVGMRKREARDAAKAELAAE